MSDIVSNLKDAINPSRRENATAPDYDPKTRGAYAEQPANSEPQVAPPAEPKAASNTNFSAPEGTYGPHSSKIANALDPRVDSDRDGHPTHGTSKLGGAAAKPADKSST